MKRFAFATLLTVMIAAPSFARTHKNMYSVPCGKLWLAVKDTVRNSGDYQIIWLDNNEMIASYAIGVGSNMRINSTVLTAQGDSCEMQVQTAFSGAFNNDAGDFKSRVDAALTKQSK
ncbi:MAG: hypothetical protein ACLQLC_01015 [Candidatus Sulfotelmatobacter sp.]